MNKNFELEFEYDTEISALAINRSLYNEINKLGPFGNENIQPIFLIKDVKILRSRLVNESHINSIIKSKSGSSINAICFNCVNTRLGEYLLSYKKEINVIAQISENSFRGKNSIQLNIKDMSLRVN